MFYKLQQDMCRAYGYVSKSTGEVVKLTPSVKMIYTYVLHRYGFFVLNKGGEMYETQATIANACCLDIKTVNKTITSFIEHQVIAADINTPIGGGYPRYSYKHVDNDLLFVDKLGVMIRSGI